MLTARPATEADILYMAPRLREADRQEVGAALGECTLDTLFLGLRTSVAPMVGVDAESRPVCIGGVVPCFEPTVGAVWALATTAIEQHPISFLRRSRPWVERWNREFPLIHNCVDERNTLHIRWLRWLGFTFIRRHPEWGHARLPFLEFVRIGGSHL